MGNEQHNIKQAVPFFVVSDMEASLKFYVDGLGFAVQNTWTPRGKIEWCWLQRDSAALMLQEPRLANGETFLAGDRPGAGVSVCFMCADAIALYHEFKPKGIKIAEPFVGNGLWDVKLTDPDEYNLHFESPTDVPEETTYSDWLKSHKAD